MSDTAHSPDLQPNKLHAVRPLRARVLELAGPLSIDVVGLVGFALIVRGVFLNWGGGWALIAAGLPIAAAYVSHEIRAARRRGPE